MKHLDAPKPIDVPTFADAMSETLAECVGDLYVIRRKLERTVWPVFNHEKQVAIDKLDEAAFWIKSIPVPINRD